MNQETINIRIKKMHPEAKIPRYAKPGDAGLDLTATSKWHDDDGNVCYGFGLAFEIPEGYVGLVFPRSSNSGMISFSIRFWGNVKRERAPGKSSKSVSLRKGLLLHSVSG